MARQQDERMKKKSKAQHDADLAKIEQKLDHLGQLEAELAKLEAEESESEREIPEVQELVWQLIDGEIEDTQFRRLEQLVLEDAEARETYVRCLQMHVDLTYYFAEQRAKETGTPSRFALPLEGLPNFNPDMTSH